MAETAGVYTPRDQRNYRNIRAVAVLFILLGCILVLGGVVGMAGDPPPGREPLHPAFSIALTLIGLAGVVGGIATLRGSRRWAYLVYGIAVIYLLAFPIGTILSYVMLKGLSRYLDMREQQKHVAIGTA